MEKKKPPSTKKEVTKPNTSKNKKPLRVVYISNPMKVKTSAAGFRDLVQRLTGKGADWPELAPSTAAYNFSDSRTDPNSRNDNESNDISIIAAGSGNCTGIVKGGGAKVGSGTADPSPDASAGSCDLYLQPLDHEYDDDCVEGGGDDRVVLIDHHMMMLDDDYGFTGLIQSGGQDSLINV